ncbi:hypothetical protein MKW98_028817 [Papaver atlanticum]|uniref:Uncharacterized protein n=1 Tax=Papaver atlanticum TaxID=357466 RepID=A0AAD4SCH7_9MAGN|nr:hypothetical protein MKW98_028817 [Papaver atlanticum]
MDPAIFEEDDDDGGSSTRMSTWRKDKDPSLVKELVSKAATMKITDEPICHNNSFIRYLIIATPVNCDDKITIEFTETNEENVLVSCLNEHLDKLNPKILGFSFRSLKNRTPISWIQFSTSNATVMYKLRDNIIPTCLPVLFKFQDIKLLGVNLVNYLKEALLNQHNTNDLIGPTADFITVDASTVSNAKVDKELLSSLMARLSLLDDKLKWKMLAQCGSVMDLWK